MLTRYTLKGIIYAIALAPLAFYSGGDLEVLLFPVVRNQSDPPTWMQPAADGVMTDACWTRGFDKFRAAKAERLTHTISGTDAQGEPHAYPATTRRLGDDPSAPPELLSRPPGRGYVESRCTTVPQTILGRPFRVVGEADFRAHPLWVLTQTTVDLSYGVAP